jgi:hypothetical protein
LADSVADASPEALADYARARRFEKKADGPDYVHCSMAMQIGITLNPESIDDLCRLYACAVECFRHSRFAEQGSMYDFWHEFLATGHA